MQQNNQSFAIIKENAGSYCEIWTICGIGRIKRKSAHHDTVKGTLKRNVHVYKIQGLKTVLCNKVVRIKNAIPRTHITHTPTGSVQSLFKPLRPNPQILTITKEPDGKPDNTASLLVQYVPFFQTVSPFTWCSMA